WIPRGILRSWFRRPRWAWNRDRLLLRRCQVTDSSQPCSTSPSVSPERHAGAEGWDIPNPCGMVIGDRSYEVAYFFNLFSLFRSKNRTSFSWTRLISTSLAG